MPEEMGAALYALALSINILLKRQKEFFKTKDRALLDDCRKREKILIETTDKLIAEMEGQNAG